jgi:hypothetical protein
LVGAPDAAGDGGEEVLQAVADRKIRKRADERRDVMKYYAGLDVSLKETSICGSTRQGWPSTRSGLAPIAVMARRCRRGSRSWQ